MTENNESAFEHTLQEMVAKRMQIARDLAGRAEQLQAHRDRLEAAEGEYRASYDLALSNGWSNADLRKIGLPTPAAKPRTRTRRKPKSSNPDQSSDND